MTHRRGSRLLLRAICTTVFALLAVVGRAGPPAAPLRLLDRTLPHAVPTLFDRSGNITFHSFPDVAAAKAEETTIRSSEFVAWGNPAEFGQRVYVLLVDGSILAVESVSMSNDSLEIVPTTLVLAERKLRPEIVRGIVYRPPATTAARDRMFRTVATAVGDRDRAILLGGDELAGTLTALDGRHATLAGDVGPAKLELARLAAVVFNPALGDKPTAATDGMLVGFRDGSRVVCRSVVGTDAALHLEPACEAMGKTWDADAAELALLQSLNGKVKYLSDLEPTGYRHVPYLELPRPYQVDRSADGNTLRSGGRCFLRGIGMHSTSRLTFPLDGRHARFRAEIAIDDETDGRGSVVFRVFVDAEERFRSDVVRGGDAPRAVQVDVAGGRQLSLVVDFAERGDEQDHADWLNARLVP